MINSEIGEVKVSKDVIDTIVRLSIAEIESVANFSQNSDKKRKELSVEVEGKVVKVGAYIKLYHGSDIKTEVEKIQQNIVNSVQTMLGLEVKKVNICVYDIVLKEEN